MTTLPSPHAAPDVPPPNGTRAIPPGATGALLPAGATVLVATDGSGLAGNAARVAAVLADRAAVAARAIHVVDTRAMPLPPPVDLAIALGDDLVGAGVHAEQELEVRAGIERAVGGAVDWPVHLAIGRPAAEIGREAERVGAALVVVGLQPHARLARLGRDETVVALMRAGTRPVLGVAESLAGMPRRAHVAVDFTRASLGAARGALALIAPGGTLTLVYVPPLALDDAEDGEHLVHSSASDAAFAWVEERSPRPPACASSARCCAGGSRARRRAAARARRGDGRGPAGAREPAARAVERLCSGAPRPTSCATGACRSSPCRPARRTTATCRGRTRRPWCIDAARGGGTPGRPTRAPVADMWDTEEGATRGGGWPRRAVLGGAAATAATAAALAVAARRWDGATAHAVARPARRCRRRRPVGRVRPGPARRRARAGAALLRLRAPAGTAPRPPGAGPARGGVRVASRGMETVHLGAGLHRGPARLRMGRAAPDGRAPVGDRLAVRVRDGYAAGVGSMRAAIAALVPVARQEGTPEIAASALWRYLAEAVWFPTALLPSERLTWTPVDDSTARATLRDRGATAVADFHFGSRGEVVRVTGSRYRAVGAGQVLTPTEGWHRAYARVGGMMIPTEGEVAWLLPEGPHAYWRARVVRATYAYDAR
jgi:hypothetical protein